MRTFIALEPPESLRREAVRLGRELAGHFPGVRWSSPENIHLTLRFLGEIDPRELAKLVSSVNAAAVGTGRLDLRVGRFGWFGPDRSPRVLWLGIEDNPSLAGLAARLERELVAAGFGRADKPFKAHLTLARIRKPLPRQPDRSAVERIARREWPAWTAESLEVIKSTLTPEGPVYETLAVVPTA